MNSTIYVQNGYAASNDPPVNGILKRTESKGRGSKRRSNRPANGGHDNKAYRNSVDGDDYSSVNGAPSTESTRGGIDLHYEEEVARKERRSYSNRPSRRRNDDSTDETGDSVFHNKAYVDDEKDDRSLRVRPDRRHRDRDDSSDSYVSSSRGAVSYITDTTNRTRTDSTCRSTDDRGSQSSTTDGTHDHHFVKGDNARRSGRSRSHSKSSSQSGQRRRPRVSQSAGGDVSDGNGSHRSDHRPSSGGSHHRRRSRSREREKKPSPYIGAFADAKKKKRKKRSKAVLLFPAETRGGDSVHFENTLGGSRSRAARASSDRSSTTNGYRSTSGSQRGRSSHNHDNNGYVSSNESSVTNKKVSRNPIPIKSVDGAKFEMATETTTHRFTKRDGSAKKKVNLDHDKEIKQQLKKERPKDEIDSARVGLIQKSKPNDNIQSLVRSSSEKRNTGLRSTIESRAETSSDTLSSHSDRRSRRDDRQSGRSHNDRYEKRSKDSATRRSSYRESQSHDRRDRIGSTRSRNNSTSRANRPAYKDEYDTGEHRSRQSLGDTSRHHEKNYSDYDSDHRSRRREKYDRNPGYDSDARRRHHDYDSDRGGRDRGYDSETRRRHRDYDSDRGGRDRGYDSETRRRHRDYDSDRGGRDRSQRRHDQGDRNYSDYESDHGRRRDSSRRRRLPQTDKNNRDYDSDGNSYRSSRHRHSQRQDHRDKYYSDEDLVESRRQRDGSLSRKLRPRSQSYSRDSRR